MTTNDIINKGILVDFLDYTELNVFSSVNEFDIFLDILTNVFDEYDSQVVSWDSIEDVKADTIVYCG